MTFFNLTPWIIFFPIIGLIINLVFGRRLKEKVIGTIASLAVGLAFIVSVLLAVSLVNHPEGETYILADWLSVGSLTIHWAFLVDTLSVTMMLVVSGVGTLIHIYAIGYMSDDVRFQGDPSRYRRFFVFMNLFIVAMMVLVSGDSYLTLFVGWEGVGLCSYLLIGFWFEKGKDGIGNALAAKKAFVTNRIGDFGFLLAIFLIFWSTGALDFSTVFSKASSLFPTVVMSITLLMLVGVTGKSAQIPLYVWLPDAMAGPTPVSALIHAATMVTAGVYLITRSAPLFQMVPEASNIVALVGAVTALFAATIALAQFDIKKVLAYSTISQLGFMVAAVGMGAYVAGMFHLVTHAFFKALLFLASGSVILGLEHAHHHVEHDPHLKKQMKTFNAAHAPPHIVHPAQSTKSAAMSDTHTAETHTAPDTHAFDAQDMRNMGGLHNKMKVTFWVYLIGALTLSGIFPLAGFWSKDEILGEASGLLRTVFVLLTITSFLTAFYMARQIFLVFFGKPRSPVAEHACESKPIITVPLIILASLAAFGGVLNLPRLHTLTQWLEHTLPFIHAGEFIFWIALLSTLLALVAIALAWWLYVRRAAELHKLPLSKRPDDPLRQVLFGVFRVLENKYWVDEVYWTIILNPYIALSKFLADVIDGRFWHDWFHDRVLVAGYNLLTRLLSLKIDLGGIDWFANKLADWTQALARQTRRLQTGYVRNYALSIFLGVILILGYLILK
jgi:NADH-quinone oxidoreductase subunit L